MACPNCGERLLHPQAGALFCCRCGRARRDLESPRVVSLLRSHGLGIVAALLCLPLSCTMVLLDGMQPTGAETGTAAEVR